MNERLVADWLTKAGERGGLDVAFCQILLARGCRVLQARHSPTENGKDIISLEAVNGLCAYQIKSGDIDLTEFEKILPQITALIESAVLHPSVRSGTQHNSFLVTTGKFTESVESRVQALNVSWRRRGYKNLTLIRGTELQPEFVKLASDFWPENPPDTSSFYKLYLAEGKGDLDHKQFAEFLRRLMPEGKLSKPAVARRIAAAGLFSSYLLEPFNRQGDHWSAFCGWTITAAHQAWAAEVYQLPAKQWESSFQLTKGAALEALKRLMTETLAHKALMPHEPELDDYTRLRNTIAISAVAAWHLIQRRAGEHPASLDGAIVLVRKLVGDGRIYFWGESALPHFLTICWLLENFGQSWMGEELLLNIMGLLTRHNRRLSERPIASPDKLPDEVFSSLLKKRSAPAAGLKHGRPAVVSWSLDPLLHLVARRMRRQALKSRWWDITQVEMASFCPHRPADTLLWHSEHGEEKERLAGKPQSWKELTSVAQLNDLSGLPTVLQKDPDFALMFALAYPHRASSSLVIALDKWFE
ncbi:MAG TPA: hypothetical protein VG347_10950 [Verrucomicrobiae bacterium]|nr:hypothetical protein [Verrucomicrobiae bacterium]